MFCLNAKNIYTTKSKTERAIRRMRNSARERHKHRAFSCHFATTQTTQTNERLQQSFFRKMNTFLQTGKNSCCYRALLHCYCTLIAMLSTPRVVECFKILFSKKKTFSLFAHNIATLRTVVSVCNKLSIVLSISSSHCFLLQLQAHFILQKENFATTRSTLNCFLL